MNTNLSTITCCLTVSLSFSFALPAELPPDDPARTLTPEEIVTGQLMALISDWAGTWQAQLPDLFISHYELDYVAPGFSSRQAWLDDRRSKLVEPEYIRLRLIDFELVSLTETEAVTRFSLVYERPGYADETLKELVIGNNNGLWLIREETNVRVTPR
jgi:hypothetical protein